MSKEVYNRIKAVLAEKGKSKSELTIIERHLTNIGFTFGLFIVIVGVLMKIFDFYTSGFSFGVREGTPYPDLPHKETLDGWGTIFLGCVCISISALFKYGGTSKYKNDHDRSTYR